MPSGLLIRLIVAFALTIACFSGSTIYSSHISGEIDRGALSIAHNAMPSIEHLSTVRAELRRVESALGHYAVSRDPRDHDEVIEARAQADDAFERYLALPDSYVEEMALWSGLHRALAAADRAVNGALEQVGKQPPRDIMLSVQPSMNQAAEALRLTIDANAERAGALALHIETGRRRATRVALLLDLLSALFTIIAAYLTVRALAHYARILDERNRLAARRAEELEQFAGRVAHDVLGPLSATRLAVAYAHKTTDDQALGRMLERGLRGVERVSTIVDGLLRFARAGAQPEPGVITMMAPVVEQLVAEMEPAANAAGVTLMLEPRPPPACSVHGNAGVISSVIENLTRNAVKYMGDRPIKRVTLRVRADEERVRFEVLDTGPGIPPLLLPTVFDAHVRGKNTHQPGIGLGLATVKRIVEAHGGMVGVESRVGEGSRFWVELPRADTVEEHPLPRRASAAAEGDGKSEGGDGKSEGDGKGEGEDEGSRAFH
jgi:signal transduction histidine kinase